MWFVGLDVHERMSCICILDENGKTIKEQKVKGHWVTLIDELKKIPERFAVCYEASLGYGYLHDQLSRVAHRVVVAHPGHVRLIFQSKRKTDRIDARKLAKLLYFDAIPAVHVPNQGVREWRRLIEFRQRQIGRRTQLKNSLRSLLKRYGVSARPGKRLWTAAGMAWLAEQELPEAAALERDLLLEEMQALKPKIQRVERQLKKQSDAHPGVHLLMTIPGVGVRTAEAVIAYIDDPRRFSRNKQVGSYFGLVPCEDTSVKQRLGHITGDGPSTARKLLLEAAWQSVRRSPTVRARFERIHGDKQDRKKIAIVAVAHYLARVMHAMLMTGEVWRGEPQKAAA